MDEEEMELSGESSLVSNLHNFTFDISWTNPARDSSPPLHRINSFPSPARFSAVSTPVPRNWKSLMLKEKPDNTQLCSTVKVSHKSLASYISDGHVKSPDHRKVAYPDHRSFSPMECDQSESTEESNNPKFKKRHSDFGIRYFSSKTTDIPKLESIKDCSPVSRRNSNQNHCDEPSLEDSVFLSPQVTKRKFVTKGDINANECTTTTTSRRSNTPDSMSKSSFMILLLVALLSTSIGTYIYFQMEWCAVFDVDTVKLQHKLEDSVFGQHIAVKSVIEALEKFKDDIKNQNGKRSLVLSFHGWTGIGKNYVSRFISEAFYNAKVSLFVGPLHLVERYKSEKENRTTQIKDWILKNATRCGVNVIIIDEVDKAERDSLEGIQSAVETLNKKSTLKTSNGVKLGPITVFLFLSNSKASQINHYLFAQMMKERKRELIRKSEFDSIFEDSQSDWYHGMKTNGQIDYFVPFLPLTENHVKHCIERDFIKKGRNPSESLIMAVMEELTFVDMGGKSGQISLTGCKRVHDKVDLHLDD